MTRSLLGLLLLAVCGCGASDGGTSDAPDAAPSADARAGADAAPSVDAGPVTITGTAVTTYVFDDGQLDVAQDLSSLADCGDEIRQPLRHLRFGGADGLRG